MKFRIKRVNAGRYRYGPYEIVKSAKDRWELWIDGGDKPRAGNIVDVYRTYAKAKADAIEDAGAAIADQLRKEGIEHVGKSLNFGGGEPTPPDPINARLAEQALDVFDGLLGVDPYGGMDADHPFRKLVASRDTLVREKEAVPDYTGQWADKDYYADEQEDFNRAVDAFGEAVRTASSIK